jgi:hypothetical protein
MTEPNGAAPAQVADGAQPQAGNGAPPAGASQGGTQLTDVSALQKELDDARKEAAQSRTRLKGYEDAESARAEAAKSELQKATERAEAAEKARDEGLSQVKSFQLRLSTVEAARRLGFRNPDIAHRLISESDVEFTAEGAPKNIDQLLTKIGQSDPYLLTTKPGAPDLGGGPRGTAPGEDVNTMIRRAAGRQG